MKSMSSFTELHVIPNLYDFCGTPQKSYFDTNKFYFTLTFQVSIFCQGNQTCLDMIPQNIFFTPNKHEG